MVFVLSDFRKAGMPPLAICPSREGAQRIADALGLGEHAFIEDDDPYRAFRRLSDAQHPADRMTSVWSAW